LQSETELVYDLSSVYQAGWDLVYRVSKDAVFN
jgi:hypothetical protein